MGYSNGVTCRFWLGVHMAAWLERTDVGVMLSHRTLARRKRMPRAAGEWVLDSGGYTELHLNGQWTVEPEAYAAAIDRYAAECGALVWAAPQDWLCLPPLLCTHRRCANCLLYALQWRERVLEAIAAGERDGHQLQLRVA